jgi:hypothetical protein
MSQHRKKFIFSLVRLGQFRFRPLAIRDIPHDLGVSPQLS